MSRTSTRLLAIVIGLAAGLIVLGAFADRLGLIGVTGTAGQATSTVRGPTPSAVKGLKQVRSLGDLARGTGVRSGERVEVRLDEESLNRDVTEYLQASAQEVTVSNTRVDLRPGQVIFTGSVRRGVLATEFTMTSHPEIRNRQLMLVIDSIEPGLVAQFSPVQPGQTMELAPNLEAESVEVIDGLMVVVGVVK
jgi:hypothetical protein